MIGFVRSSKARSVHRSKAQSALRDLLPARRRPRVKARTRKNPTSKYGLSTGQHPATAQPDTFHTQVTFLDEGLAPRTRRQTQRSKRNDGALVSISHQRRRCAAPPSCVPSRSWARLAADGLVDHDEIHGGRLRRYYRPTDRAIACLHTEISG